MNDRERLEAIVKVVRQYLPPDGISIKEAMGKIIELVDPLPPKKQWVEIPYEELQQIYYFRKTLNLSDLEGFARAIERVSKEKNQ